MRLVRVIRRSISVTTAILFISGLAYSQAQTGSLSGSVLDANDAAVPGASVDVRETRTGVTAHTISSDAGLYVFPSLAPGLWTVTAEKPGFKKLVRTDIEIFIAQRQALDLKLEVGDVKQSVEVAANQTLLETETSEKGQSLTPKMYQTLPLWSGGLQNPSAFLSYMANVNSGSELSIAGSTGPLARAIDRRHEQRDSGIGRHGVQSAVGGSVQRGQVDCGNLFRGVRASRRRNRNLHHAVRNERPSRDLVLQHAAGHLERGGLERQSESRE